MSLYPKEVDFDGDYALRFEMFMSYNGPAYGGTGSTEFATMGVGQSGERPTNPARWHTIAQPIDGASATCQLHAQNSSTHLLSIGIDIGSIHTLRPP